MKRLTNLLWVAVCVLGAAYPLNAANEYDTDRSMHVKFSEPIIELPEGTQSGGIELIKLKAHRLGKLLLRHGVESIRYAYPPEYRIDSVVHNRYGIPVKRPNYDGIFRVTLADNASREECLAALDGEDGVLLATPCVPVQTAEYFPDDTGFHRHWGLHNEGGDWIVPDADIDASGYGPLDIADLVYLVDYMFTGGPAPPACP